jgi:hypothetical protein
MMIWGKLCLEIRRDASMGVDLQGKYIKSIALIN